RRRRRRLALRSMAGAAALTAAAIALVTVVLPGEFLGGHGGAVAQAAYVVKRVDSALNSAEPGEMAQMTVTTTSTGIQGPAATTTAEEWSYDGQWRSVVNSLGGKFVYDEGWNGSSVYTMVSYAERAWARQHVPDYPAGTSPGPRGCGPAVSEFPLLFRYGLPGIGLPASSLPSTVATAVRTAISCGTLVADGRQRVGGIEAIKLTSSEPSLLSETIWVDPGSYLPVRVVVRSPDGMPGGVQQKANITWLAPTAANLAKLKVPVPAGFRQVPLAEAVLPVWKLLPGAGLPGGLLPEMGLPESKGFCVGAGGMVCKTAPAVLGLGFPGFPLSWSLMVRKSAAGR
ncbi:MAG: hypothetical protein ACRDN0_05060, partial [Trebonia sp.]